MLKYVLPIPAALLLALIYGIHATWRDIQAKRWVWVGVGVFTTLTVILALALVATLFIPRFWGSW
jgi:hypothetical protein